ncbi:endonuclease [Escherichia coli]|uniref:thermonuclease family protein n=1 Tax=Escherichia coli TaxID=562 RepID=UPI0004A059CF|nr:endonuclease [Escherichia coli]EYB64730.1 endonuclease [Escherichia coli]
MRKYIPLVLFIFSWPVLCADIHGRVVRVLDGDTIEVMDSRKAVRIRLINIDAPEKKQDYGRWSTDTWVYEQYNTDPVLPVLQNEARQQKRGLWSDADPIPPWIWRHRK